MPSPNRQAQDFPQPAVLSAIPPHVLGKPRRGRRKGLKARACYTRPGPSPLRHSFTPEDLLRDAARAAREPWYSNPYNSRPCHYHYLFPPGSPYESWNPSLSIDFWPRAHHYYTQDRTTKYHYLFSPGTPYESWNPTVAVHSWNVVPNDVGAGSRAETEVAEHKIEHEIGKNSFEYASPPSLKCPPLLTGKCGYRHCHGRHRCVLSTL